MGGSSHEHPSRTGRARPEVVLRWVPVGISVAALGLTLFQLFDERAATSYAARPIIDFFTEDDSTEPKVGIEISNDGPGVAIVKKVTYYVDKKPVADDGVAEDKSRTDPDLIKVVEYATDDAIASGHSDWIFFRPTSDKKDIDRFTDYVDDHLSIGVSYCSLQGQCWWKCSTPGWCPGQ
jgi:hypothetical protein